MEATRREAAVRVWVDDQHPIFRRGLISCLGAAGYVVAGESAALRPEPEFRRIDVLVFQADNQGLSRVVVATAGMPVRLVGLVASQNDPTVFDLVDRGVSAVLFRNQLAPQALTTAISSVMNGNSALPAELMPRLLERAARSGGGGPHPLTDRELQVLRSLSHGDDTREIADAMGYSVRTVKNIVHDLLMKTNSRNRAHAVALATRQGLI
ncbi:MAG: response regulator transcription factor [Actinomycetota bacterium]|nr:response regulator transcription factor [Actinomycetota bacterium]